MAIPKDAFVLWGTGLEPLERLHGNGQGFQQLRSWDWDPSGMSSEVEGPDPVSWKDADWHDERHGDSVVVRARYGIRMPTFSHLEEIEERGGGLLSLFGVACSPTWTGSGSVVPGPHPNSLLSSPLLSGFQFWVWVGPPPKMYSTSPWWPVWLATLLDYLTRITSPGFLSGYLLWERCHLGLFLRTWKEPITCDAIRNWCNL